MVKDDGRCEVVEGGYSGSSSMIRITGVSGSVEMKVYARRIKVVRVVG